MMIQSHVGELQESTLVGRLRGGDEEAFAALVRAHAPRLLAVTRRILSNEEDARDAVQETFVASFRSISSFREGSRLSTWLHRIAVNAALMRLRSARRHEEEPLEEESAGELLPAFDATGHRIVTDSWCCTSPETEQLREQLRSRVRRAIADLPPNYRTVVLLRDIEELTTRETAEILGVTETAVKLRLHRAHQALRTLLERTMVA